MTDEFHIHAEWPRPPANGERDVAHLAIALNDEVFTRLVDIEQNMTRDYFRASAVALGLWFADNWWRLRWEPVHDPRHPSAEWRMRHELTSASGGTLWPPLMIYGTGERVLLAPALGGRTRGGPARYLEPPVRAMSGQAYERGLDRYFRTVIAVCGDAQDGATLADIIRQLGQERNDPDLAAWRRMEARLGYDPEKAPEGVIERLEDFEDRLGEESVEEAATAAPGAGAPDALEAAIEASEASRLEVDLEIARVVPSEVLEGRAPWQAAEDAADRVRQAAGLDGHPVLGHALADILRVDWEALKSAPATARRLPYGARLKRRGANEGVALQTVWARDRRFELARLIGDAVWTGESNFGVVSRAKTERQKFQRAFAQSLLCPFETLRQRVDLANPSEAEIDAAGRYFHVHPSVVRTLLVNKGVLPRETLADALEAA